MDEKNEKTEEVNVVKEFIESDDFTKFFPDQLIVFWSFEFPKIIIQTIMKMDKDKYLQNPNDESIQFIEYQVNINYKPDPDHIGPEEESTHIKITDKENPFVLSILSKHELNASVEDDYLNNFKTIFIKLLEIILSNLGEEDIKNLNEEL